MAGFSQRVAELMKHETVGDPDGLSVCQYTAKDVPLIQQKRNQRSIRCGTVVLEKGRGMGEQEVLTSGAYAPELVVYIKQ